MSNEPQYIGRYLAYAAVHHIKPDKVHQVDLVRWGHRNVGLTLWDGFNRLWTPKEIQKRMERN